YLQETDDTLFHPDTLHQRSGPPSAEDLIRRLQAKSPSARMAALWEAAEQPQAVPELVAAVTRCLQDRDPRIPGEAARTLGARAPRPPENPVEAPCSAAPPDPGAGGALPRAVLPAPAPPLVPELCAFLRDPERDVVYEAPRALASFGGAADPAIPHLLPLLRS